MFVTTTAALRAAEREAQAEQAEEFARIVSDQRNQPSPEVAVLTALVDEGNRQ